MSQHEISFEVFDPLLFCQPGGKAFLSMHFSFSKWYVSLFLKNVWNSKVA